MSIKEVPQAGLQPFRTIRGRMKNQVRRVQIMAQHYQDDYNAIFNNAAGRSPATAAQRLQDFGEQYFTIMNATREFLMAIDPTLIPDEMQAIPEFIQNSDKTVTISTAIKSGFIKSDQVQVASPALDSNRG